MLLGCSLWWPVACPFQAWKGMEGSPHFLTPLPCPLPWLIGRYSFTAAWSKEVRKGRKGEDERVKHFLDLIATLPVTLLITHGPLQTPESTFCRQEHSGSQAALMAVVSSSGGWELWFPFKNQVASIFCPKGVCYNFCSTKGQFSFLLSSVVIMCVCKRISRNWKEETTLCALPACLRNRSWGSLFYPRWISVFLCLQLSGHGGDNSYLKV